MADSDNIKDYGRYVVKEIHHGSISPGKRDEMWRDIYLDRGAVVKGGVFGNNLTVLNPGIKVEQSVYVRNAIRIDLSSGEKSEMVVFNSNVVSPDSIIVEGSGARARFSTDIYVEKVNLNNTIVYGNIYCTSAILKNCIILGGVYCKNKLSVENSVLYTFDAEMLDIGENLSLLSPFGISRTPFELNYPVRALVFYNLLQGHTEKSLAVVLNEDDVFGLSVTKKSDGGSVAKRYLLSIVERVLNTTEIIDSFKQNKKIIEFLALGSHLSKEYADQFSDIQKNDLEARLWQVIDQHIESSGEERLKDLREVLERLYAG